MAKYIKNRNLQLQHLDTKMQVAAGMHKLASPPVGWVKTIRTSIGMSLEQLGKKLSITKQSALHIEKREREGSITLNALRQAANAMDMDMVYAFVPKDGTLEDLIERKAKELAEKIVGRASQTMLLEDQGVSYARTQKSIEEKTKKFKETLPKILWD